MLGIVLSLFCGILVSRLVTEVWMNKQRHFNYFTGLSKRIFKHANFKFIEYRKVAYGISIVILILGVASFFNGFHEGVEFKGGRSYTVLFEQDVKNDQIQDDLKAAFVGDFPVIKKVGDNRHLNITTSYLLGQDNTDSIVRTKLFEGLKKVLPANITYNDFIKTDPKKASIQSSTTVQPSISDDLKRGAVKATIFAIFVIFIYIFIRFRDWRYSMGTIVALLHDVLVTLAVFSFFKNIVPFPLEIDQHFIAAVLTVIGFSMNDTVIVFDRIREYSKGSKADQKGTIINRAINDTLSRTIMTSLTVFLTLLILFIFGGEVTRGFAFAMLIGVITGTYSSIFGAAPILVDFAKDKPLGEAEIISSEKTEKVVVANKA
jgi:SecD/SecF fusion protein